VKGRRKIMRPLARRNDPGAEIDQIEFVEG
jgi:hypothetical protein